MLEWIFFIGGVMVGFVAVVVLVGLMLPKKHRATRAARFKQLPETLFAAVTKPQEWRAGVTQLPDVNGRRRWQEVAGRMVIVFEEVERQEPRMFRWRIVNKDLPFSGVWTWEITAADGGSVCRITEDGEVTNPIFRFVSRFVLGYAKTMEGYLRAMGKKFGEEVKLEE